MRHKPAIILKAARKKHPDFFKAAEEAVENRAALFPDFWDRSLLPIEMLNEIAAKTTPYVKTGSETSLISVFNWQYGKSIYKIDSSLAKALMQSKLVESMPANQLYQLPDFCSYIDLSDLDLSLESTNTKLYGMMVYIERSIEDQDNYLCVDYILDNNRSRCFMCCIIDGSMQEAFDHTRQTMITRAFQRNMDSSRIDEIATAYARGVSFAMPLILYICSEGVEYRGDIKRASKPFQRVGKKGKFRLPENPRVWHLGERSGERIREAQKAVKNAESQRTVSPHVRRAHWHSFWKGPRDGERQLVAKFLPPILVTGSDNNG